MKNQFILFLLFSFIVAQSCTVGKLTEDSDYLFEDNKNPTQVYYTNLADVIKATGKASSTGNGVIRIRGMNSIVGDTRPYFFVNDIPMGRSYESVNSSINVQNIEKIEIISSLSQLAIYGANGNAGIIKITTFKQNN